MQRISIPRSLYQRLAEHLSIHEATDMSAKILLDDLQREHRVQSIPFVRDILRKREPNAFN